MAQDSTERVEEAGPSEERERFSTLPQIPSTRLDRILERAGHLFDRAYGDAGRLLARRPLGDWREVPVVINSFNRLAWLRELVSWVRAAGMTRILVIDNASTFPPLLEWLTRTNEAEVVHLGRNVGSFALWRTPIWRRVIRSHYVYTDPDVLPVGECPRDVVRHLGEVLARTRWAHKAGLGLRIDDLPDHYARKADVIRWEQAHWTHPLPGGLYQAGVDTTFALYRPWARGGWWIPAVRTGPPLVARHLPWYQDSSVIDEEEQHYRSAIRRESSHWTA